MQCKNCQQEFEGNYCRYCGQHRRVERIDFHFLLGEISSTIFQLKNGLLFTIKELLLRPGPALKDYLAGKRVGYVRPVAFVLISSAIYALISHFIGRNTFLGDLMNGIAAGVQRGEKEETLTNLMAIFRWIGDNQAYANLFLVPVFAFIFYLIFRKKGYNYFEHLVLNLYLSGLQLILNAGCYLIFSPLGEKASYADVVPLILGLGYTYWVYAVISGKKVIVLRFVLGFILYGLTLTLLIVAALFAELGLGR